VKLLLLFAHDYWLKPFQKTLPDVPDVETRVESNNAVVALVHVEPHDTQGKLVTKANKHIKWLAGKFETRNVVLHSFAHLTNARADPADAEAILQQMRERLAGSGYQVDSSPFGYFNEFRVHVAGPSLAKVFVEI
jgi:hypothetical protein